MVFLLFLVFLQVTAHLPDNHNEFHHKIEVHTFVLQNTIIEEDALQKNISVSNVIKTPLLPLRNHFKEPQ